MAGTSLALHFDRLFAHYLHTQPIDRHRLTPKTDGLSRRITAKDDRGRLAARGTNSSHGNRPLSHDVVIHHPNRALTSNSSREQLINAQTIHGIPQSTHRINEAFERYYSDPERLGEIDALAKEFAQEHFAEIKNFAPPDIFDEFSKLLHNKMSTVGMRRNLLIPTTSNTPRIYRNMSRDALNQHMPALGQR